MLDRSFGFCCWSAICLAVAFAARGDETFETLKVGTNVFRNARIIQASPVDLLIGHEEGYKRIKLQDLPDDLKARYPYDAQKAAEFQKEETRKRQLLLAQNSAASRNALLAKEAQLRASIADRKKDLRRITKDIATQDRRKKGKGVNSADRKFADELRRQKIEIRDQMWRLQDELERTEALRHKYD